MRAIEDLPTRMGSTAAHLPLASIGPQAADKIYENLLQGPRKADRATQAGYAINIARRAWNLDQRKYSDVVPAGNPWMRVERIGRKGTKPAANRREVYAWVEALEAIGEPHLGAAALICFELLQRPERVLAGDLT
jgi:hypothetical protein